MQVIALTDPGGARAHHSVTRNLDAGSSLWIKPTLMLETAYGPAREPVGGSFSDVVEFCQEDVIAVPAPLFTKLRNCPGLVSGGDVVVLKSDET